MLVVRLCGDTVPKSWNRWGRPLSRGSHRVWAFPLPSMMDLADLVEALVVETPPELLPGCLAVWIQPDFDGRLSISVLEELEPLSVLHTRLHDPWILESLSPRVRTHFQAIVGLSANAGLFGYQMRCHVQDPDGRRLSARELYLLARQARRLEALEQACQINALVLQAESLPRGIPVFISALPQSLLHQDLHRHPCYSCLERLGLEPGDVVIEITQRGQWDDVAALAHSCETLRSMGFRIGLSEVGAGLGQAGLMVELEPDFIRFDVGWIREAQASPTGASLIRVLVATVRHGGGASVVEGIETLEDLRLCRELGIDYGQGDLIGPGAPIPAVPKPLPQSEPATPEPATPGHALR